MILPALGYTLAPVAPRVSGMHAALARAARENGDVLSVGITAIADGHADPVEMDRLERELNEADAANAGVRAAIVAAREAQR